MIKLALVASIAFAGLALTSVSSSAQQFYSSCPLGAEQFGGRCINGHYFAPQQRVYRQQQRRVIYLQQPQQRYVVVQERRPEQGAGLVFGLAAAILGAMAAGH